MKPVMIHADGTDCDHEGSPQRLATDDLAPLCPAGLPLTHVRIGVNVMTMGDALSSFRSIAEAVTRSLTPMVTAYAEFANRLLSSPHIRALAAAAAVIDEERAKELESGHGVPR